MADIKCVYFITAVVMLVSLGSALKCYTCTTHKDGDLCVDPFNTTLDAFNTSLVDLVDCGESMDPDPNDTAVVRCLKLIVHQMGIVGENRVSGIVATAATRGCIVSEEDGCFYTDGATSKFEKCYCNTDGCNAGTSQFITYPGSIVLLLLTALCLLYSLDITSL